MPPEKWELVFKQSLIGRAHAVAAELKDVEAEARGRSFAALLTGGLYCPEC